MIFTPILLSLQNCFCQLDEMLSFPKGQTKEAIQFFYCATRKWWTDNCQFNVRCWFGCVQVCRFSGMTIQVLNGRLRKHENLDKQGFNWSNKRLAIL